MSKTLKKRSNTAMGRRRAAVGVRLGVVTGLVLFLVGVVTVTTYSNTVVEDQLHISTDRILFVGDVLLARRVETYMEQHGSDYPFKRMIDVFKRHSDIIGNFESSIPKEHRHTPDLTYSFSTKAAYVETLEAVGFTGVSLANNHTLDKGDVGYTHTREVFGNTSIQASGHPSVLRVEDIQYYDLDGKIIAIIPLNLTYGMRPLAAVDNVLEEASENSVYQIVYVHWGIEYKLTASDTERKVAHDLIDSGADVIIGHHPHVVQDIERYRDGLIFYSLGNFIFDQFNNKEREQGLALSFYYEDAMLHFDLIPVTSEDLRSSPRPMDEEERASFLRSLALRSDLELRNEIEKGSIQFIYDME